MRLSTPLVVAEYTVCTPARLAIPPMQCRIRTAAIVDAALVHFVGRRPVQTRTAHAMLGQMRTTYNYKLRVSTL